MSAFIITEVMAGVEPSSLQSETNRLYASENMLRSIEHVLTKTTNNTPVDGTLSLNLVGGTE